LKTNVGLNPTLSLSYDKTVEDTGSGTITSYGNIAVKDSMARVLPEDAGDTLLQKGSKGGIYYSC